MLPCGLCEKKFSSNDDLMEHFKGHESQLIRENEIKNEQDSDQYSDAGSLILDCVKEEEQLEGQQEESKIFPLASYEVGEKRKRYKSKLSSETFMCSKCSFKTINKGWFSIHMKQMHLNKFMCYHCPKRFSSEGHLAKHIEKKHEDKPKLFRVTAKQQDNRFFECLMCTFKTIRRIIIYRHIRRIHKELVNVKKEEQDQQEETQVESSEKFYLASSKAGHECRKRKSSSETIMCSKCSYKTINKKMFKKHMNVMHLNTYKCNHCPKRFPSEGFLAYHQREKHVKDEEQPKLLEDEFFHIITKQKGKQNKLFYECLKCTFKTEKRSTIYQHIRGVHMKLLDELYKSKGMELEDAGYHKCTKCFYKTLIMHNLNQHIKTVHSKIRDYICDLCKKAFSAKRNLISHMKFIHISAESSELHKCSICTFKSTDKNYLKRHMNLVHLKIRRFTCDLCQMKISTKTYLREHIERHHLEKNILSCNRGSNCSFRTTKKQEFFRHIRRVHEKIRGISCKICGKWFSFSSALSTHKKTQHLTIGESNTNRLSCDLCHTTTLNSNNMYLHMNRKHLKKIVNKVGIN